MTKVVLDDTLRAKLSNLDDSIEFCDESGRTVGHYLPTETYQRLVYDWINAQISDEDLEQIRREPGGSSLSEIWQRLGRA